MRSVIRVSSVDLVTGEEDLKIERNIPSVFIFRIMLRGNLLMIHVPHNLQVFLIDWKNQACVVVDYSDSMVSLHSSLVTITDLSNSHGEQTLAHVSLLRSILWCSFTSAQSP